MNEHLARLGVIAGLVVALPKLLPAAVQHDPGHHGAAEATLPAICRLLYPNPPGTVLAAARWSDPEHHSPFLRLTDRSDAHELVIEVGPVNLPPHAMAEHSRDVFHQLGRVPFDAWVHGFRVELVDARGRLVPRRVLHHIDTSRLAFRELFISGPQRFLASGADTKYATLPGWLIGSPIYQGEPLVVSTMLHNPTDTAYDGVRVRLILAYTRSRPLIEVSGFDMDVKFPAPLKNFDLPPGRSVWSWEGSPAIPVRIIGLTGHLHKYAQWMELTDVTTGTVIWHVRPDTDASGEVHMPIQFLRLGLGHLILPSHRYRVLAVYDNPTGRTIPDGGMAKLGGIVVPARGAAWPAVDVRDSLYQEDLRFKLAEPCGLSGSETAMMHAH